ncbi:four helix bundle protein [Pedobacter yonginense]|uniref:Four helix bundle protein n=1 Tax=Pedobacter yonginense TaxID=651869 RepID=A0A317EN67_9SPHI|nr:four helix bundle protein [Pedobacter yonginense]PWS27617.1 four helix bundle protein [Pedobacter yonginense]
MRDYQKLDVWKKSHSMVLHIYNVVLPAFPAHEKYDLHSQLKRAAYSVPLNIVEGAGRRTEKDFAHFLDIALGSVHEMEYTCFLAKDLEYLEENKYLEINKMAGEVKAMLIGLIKHLRL